MSWYSPDGSLVQFTDSGIMNVSSEVTTTTVTQLLPDTEYHFRVSAITDFGRSAEVIVSHMTENAFNDGR